MANKLYKIYFDGVEMEGIHKWDALKYSLKRDADSGGIISEDTATLQFTGDAYNYLLSTYNAGLCSEVSVKIFELCGGAYSLKFKGIIFVVDCKFYLTDCICEVKINDDNYYSRINNNKSIPVLLNSQTTKNGLTMGAVSRYNRTFFDSTTCADNEIINGVKIWDALQHIIYYISDSELTFISSCFDSGGDYEGATLFSGEAFYYQDSLSTNYDRPIEFGWLFEQLQKIFNVGWDIYTVANITYFRVEKLDFYYPETKFTELNNVNNLVQSSDLEILYSKISVGCNTTTDQGQFPEDISFYGFKQEDYTLLGQCNIDKTLDLNYDIITSSNEIQNALDGINLTDGWFLVDCDNALGEPVNSNWLPSVDGCFYNEAYTNENIILRHFGGLPSFVTLYLSGLSADFQARKASNQNETDTNWHLITFTDDTATDNDNQWDTGTSFFTSQQSLIYYFNCYLSIVTGGALVTDFTARWEIRDESNVLVKDIDVAAGLTTIPFIFTDTQTIYLPKGYTLSMFFKGVTLLPSYTIASGSYIECTGHMDGSEILELINIADARMVIYEFDHALTKAEIDNFANEKIYKLPFNNGRQSYIGWVKQLDVDRINGRAKFKLIHTKRL